MKLKRCTQCNGKIEYNKDTHIYKCLYCDSEFKATNQSLDKTITAPNDITVQNQELPPKMKSLGKIAAGLIVIGLIGFGLVYFFLGSNDTVSSNVQFGEQRIQIQHSGLSLEIPDTINVRTAETERGLIPLVMPFNEEESIFVTLVQLSSLGRSEEELQEFAKTFLGNMSGHVLVNDMLALTINNSDGFIQETRQNQEISNAFAFLYFDGSVYLLQYSAPGDFFETYRPYFDEMINSIRIPS